MIKKRFKKLFAGGDPSTDNPYGVQPTATASDPANMFGSVANNMQFTPPPVDSTTNWSKVFGQAMTGASKVVPYASNIANSFRTPPLPPAPQTVNPVVLSRIDLSNARNNISRSVRGQDLNADRALNPQAAAAVRNANLAKEIEGTSQVSEQEAFLNSRQKAEQAGMNLNVDTMNATARHQADEQMMERTMAQQREQSQNLSNASDKFVQQQDQHAKEQLDLQKIGILSQMWKSSGVYDRMIKKMKDQGIDTSGIDNSQIETHAYGGRTGANAPFANGGRVPYTKGTDLEYENWFKQNTPEGLAGQDIDSTDKDYYSQYRGREKYQDSLNPLNIPGGNPMAVRRPATNVSYMAFGGFSAASAPFKRVQGRATGASQINPFGGGVKGSIGMGGGIPNGKFNVGRAARMGRMMDQGGWTYTDTPDNLMDNRSGGGYAMGGNMNYPSRPKAIRQMDFAGIEHMAAGGWPMGNIPNGNVFEEDNINRPRPAGSERDEVMYGAGGKIHIKKANRGKFTAYKARTGKTTSQALHSSDPHVRKMANFARNASHWNHKSMGGWTRPLA
jgi:hypothetical protein